jgi:hypothetical protein
MTAQKGKDLLVKIAGGGGYTTVAGLRTRRLAFNAETVDITHAESANRWRELLDGAYGVNSGTGRSGKVLRRMLGLPDDSSTVTDPVIAAARAADPKILIAAICDERLRFLQALKTWAVFGAVWGRRVAEVKSTALKMTADAAKASTMARNK